MSVIGLVALLLVVLGLAGGGLGGGMVVLGLVSVVGGVGALLIGRARWAFIATRRAGALVAVAGFLAFATGGALLPDRAPVSASPRTASAGLTTARASTPPSASARATASPESSASSEPSASAPRSAVALVPPTPSATPTPQPSPTMVITCPASSTASTATFGHQIAASAPYTVDIDYGDGRSYRNDDEHLAAVFAHAYQRAGTYTVSAVLTAPTGETATSTCDYTRAAAPARSPISTGSSASGSAGSGSAGSGSAGSGSAGSGGAGGSSDYYENSDGVEVHRPEAAPVAPDGATAQCDDGTYSFSQHRSGTCSHHGGVAQWL